jgi:hypothetical protein
MSKSIITIAAVTLVTVVAACARAPVETASGAVITTPAVTLSTEPVYTGKYK